MSTARARRRRAGPRLRRSASPEPLTGQAYRLIEEQIVTLRIVPGEVLSEYALAEQLGLGRTPIREALQRLAGEGLVAILPRKGILVTETDAGAQLLVLEVRRELERMLCRAAAGRATAEERARLREIAAGMDRASRSKDDIAFMRLDRDLNHLIVEAAHNEYAARAMRSLQGLSRRFWYLHYKTAADLPHCARLHAAQARAIADGGPDKAAKACDALMDYVESFTRATASG